MPDFEAERPGERRVARVLLDSSLPQLDHLFDYAVPEALAGEIRVGHRVRVPFRSQQRNSRGYVIGFAARSDFGGELQPISEIVGPVPQLPPELWRTARAVADRAGGSACDILRLAIPQRMVRVEKQFLAALEESCGATGTAEAEPRGGGRDPSDPRFSPSVAERETAESLAAGERFAVLPPHGPTRLGTGEWVGAWAVSLARAALAVHALGRSAIIAVPDYRDLDQLRDTLASLGGAEVLRVDARQSKGERYAAFLRTLVSKPCIVLGNRSAVYAPAHRLGAIFLWDDGDPLLSEPLAPYVHARDAALVRASLSREEDAGEPIGLWFGAHARSVEVQRLVEIGYVRAGAPARRTRVVHADASVAPEAFAGRVPDFAAQQLRRGIADGPVLVQVAAPGYSPASVCGGCGERARCASCGGPIGFRSPGRGSCRWCGDAVAAWACPSCGNRSLQQRGAGSQRTVEQFRRQFSGFRILLSDGDHPHERVDSRPALVVATRGAEPIAAGGYRAVVLLDAERLLGIESLRAGEDCLRWWQNAAALAAPDGIVVMASGGGPVVRAFVTGNAEAWLREELRDRQALRYPPSVRVASVSGGPSEVERALAALGELPGVDVLGPAPVAERSGDRARGADGTPNPSPEPGRYRAIVRFDYSLGDEVAKRLRAALVADAAGASSRAAGRGARGRARHTALRLRFDDRGVFDG
ncbi:hypothetical protein [Leucobacter weissii]|uniref:primosomal protein N' family DNA-binding protein n=1 Tax=Leucobacter weissii TaxID=1983706 RepID=UPI0031331D32